MSEPVKIAIVIQGGALVDVLSAGVAVEYVLVDYDSDVAANPVSLPRWEGDERGACVQLGDAEPDGQFVMKAFDLASEEEAPAD